MTEEIMMVPTKEFDQLVQYYKGEITDNAEQSGTIGSRKSRDTP